MKSPNVFLSSEQFNLNMINADYRKNLINLLKKNRYTLKEFGKLKLNALSFNPYIKGIITFYFKDNQRALILFTLFFLGESAKTTWVEENFDRGEIELLKKLCLIKSVKD